MHADEDDAFYIVEGEMTFIFGDERWPRRPGRSCSCRPAWSTASATSGAVPVRMLNIHAPAGFDRRIGLAD